MEGYEVYLLMNGFEINLKYNTDLINPHKTIGAKKLKYAEIDSPKHNFRARVLTIIKPLN